jgi:hypothetical protein
MSQCKVDSYWKGEADHREELPHWIPEVELCCEGCLHGGKGRRAEKNQGRLGHHLEGIFVTLEGVWKLCRRFPKTETFEVTLVQVEFVRRSRFIVLKFIGISKWRTGSLCPLTLEYLYCYFKCHAWLFGLWAMDSFIFPFCCIGHSTLTFPRWGFMTSPFEGSWFCIFFMLVVFSLYSCFHPIWF